jgi:hypothetical protein
LENVEWRETWINISMMLPIMEISDIAIDQSNSNIIYAKTGDHDGQYCPISNGYVHSPIENRERSVDEEVYENRIGVNTNFSEFYALHEFL